MTHEDKALAASITKLREMSSLVLDKQLRQVNNEI